MVIQTIIKENQNIETMIYEIRGKQVMLDSDLAKLYQVETKRINEAVKNNPNKFPERFSWIITKEEADIISRSKFSTLNEEKLKRGQNMKYLPRVFTEQGVAMLATILKSKIAIEVSIAIMDTFVAMRRYMSTDLFNQQYYNDMIIRHDQEIKNLQEYLKKVEEKKVVNEVYFAGQIYDAYSKLIDILKEAKEKLMIIDAYAEKTVLDMISRVSVPTLLIVKEEPLLKELDIEKYNQQYQNLKIIKDSTFHDRYIIIDEKKIYHCGTSINYAGSKTFSINVLEDKIVIERMLSAIQKIVHNHPRENPEIT